MPDAVTTENSETKSTQEETSSTLGKNLESQEESSKQEETSSKQESKDTNTDTATDTEVEKEYSSAKESSDGFYDTDALIQEVAKLEANIESKKSSTPDVAKFYKELESHLTEDELQLKFEDDPSLYINAVEKAKEKFLKENTTDTKEDEDKLSHAQQRLHTSKAIEEVLKDSNYKDFNFKKMAEFYQEDLTKKEQMELDKGSTKENLTEYFKKIYDEYYKRNPKKIKKVEAPTIPDTTNTSKTSVEDKTQIKQEAENKAYREKIGFRKL